MQAKDVMTELGKMWREATEEEKKVRASAYMRARVPLPHTLGCGGTGDCASRCGALRAMFLD